MTFYKYQGTGNDFILLDNQSGEWDGRLNTEEIRWLCDRRFGIGADGLMLLSAHPELDFRMVYFNSDGRESSMCGNGGRCLVAFARRMGILRDTYQFEAIDGFHEAVMVGEEVRLKMGSPQGYRSLPNEQYWIDTGSPHLVVLSKNGVEELSVYEQGKALRYDPEFSPGGVNVNFLYPEKKRQLHVRTYERGVEAETYSCGTGVTACAYVSAILKEARGADVAYEIQTPGGRLKVEIEHFQLPEESVWLQGPATFVYGGRIELP